METGGQPTPSPDPWHGTFCRGQRLLERGGRNDVAVFLSNLSARAPSTDDLEAVGELLSACAKAESDIQDYSREDLNLIWQHPQVQLQRDLWVIATRSEQIVGYAHVWPADSGRILLFACVHPVYRGRGIGTLLLRLAEMRARQRSREVEPDLRVTLEHTLNGTNAAARRLLEREGYTLVKHFWRVVVDMNASEGEQRQGKFSFDLDVGAQPGVASRLSERSGLYVVRQYCVYEKELRTGRRECEDCDERAQETIPAFV